MREKKQNEKQNPVEAEQNFKAMKDTFSEFNEFIVRLCTKVRFPFSKELYGISSRNYKFQISIALIVAGIFKERLFKKRLLQEIMKDDKKLDVFMDKIREELLNSFLENSEYNASSTNSRKIKELINGFQIE